MNADIKPLLLLPTYDGWSKNRQACINYGRNLPQSPIVEITSSALGHCFNIGYQMARMEADKGNCTHVLMLHADVQPLQNNWGELLINECEEVKAGILSVVIPIKTHEGITSTAVERKETQDKQGWHPIRFTMQEIMTMPETFTHPRLMVNTGLMVIDMRQPWTKELIFDLNSCVDLPKYRPYFLPEDWKMSRFAQSCGVSLWATRKIHVYHVGETPFGNNKAWGSKATEGALEVYQHEGYDTHGSSEGDRSDHVSVSQ